MCKTVKYYNNLDGNESIFKWINIFLFLVFGIFVNLQMYATSACRKLNNIFMLVSLFSGIYNDTLIYQEPMLHATRCNWLYKQQPKQTVQEITLKEIVSTVEAVQKVINPLCESKHPWTAGMR